MLLLLIFEQKGLLHILFTVCTVKKQLILKASKPSSRSLTNRNMLGDLIGNVLWAGYTLTVDRRWKRQILWETSELRTSLVRQRGVFGRGSTVPFSFTSFIFFFAHHNIKTCRPSPYLHQNACRNGSLFLTATCLDQDPPMFLDASWRLEQGLSLDTCIQKYLR